MAQLIVGFSRPVKWFSPFSWMIRLVQGWNPYSHVYIKFYSSTANRWLIYQASGLKVNFIGETLFNSQEVIFQELEIDISDATKLSTIQKAIDTCGEPYGVMQILGFSWVLTMRVFGKKVNNPFYSNSSTFCAELVGDVLQEIAVPADDINSSTALPQDIYNFLISKGYKTFIDPQA